jgi:hypothetical protein
MRITVYIVNVIWIKVCERLYLVLGLGTFGLWVNCPYASTTLTVQIPTTSRFLCNFLFEWPLNFWVIKIHQVIWPSPCTLYPHDRGGVTFWWNFADENVGGHLREKIALSREILISLEEEVRPGGKNVKNEYKIAAPNYIAWINLCSKHIMHEFYLEPLRFIEVVLLSIPHKWPQAAGACRPEFLRFMDMSIVWQMGKSGNFYRTAQGPPMDQSHSGSPRMGRSPIFSIAIRWIYNY